MTEDQIIRMAKAYANHTGLKLTTLGAYAVRDGKLFEQIANGRECRRKTRNALAAWFDANWPADLEWPADIPRPSKPKEKAA
jgi:hypothetical protein